MGVSEKGIVIKLKGGTMETINLPFFYELGGSLKLLTKMDSSTMNLWDLVMSAVSAKAIVQQLLERLPSLTVCRQAGEELDKHIDTFMESLKGDDKRDWNKPPESILRYNFDHIIRQAKEFEIVLSAELKGLDAYLATQKGIYATKSLIGQAEDMFPESVRAKLPQEAIVDVRESGRCLAFDTFTACGFHMLRATETVMHEYYVEVCKTEDPKVKLDNWGAYITALNKSCDKHAKQVLAILQQIKDNSRNLIMHPERVLSPDDAFTLFEVAKGAIIAMAEKLPQNKK